MQPLPKLFESYCTFDTSVNNETPYWLQTHLTYLRSYPIQRTSVEFLLMGTFVTYAFSAVVTLFVLSGISWSDCLLRLRADATISQSLENRSMFNFNALRSSTNSWPLALSRLTVWSCTSGIEPKRKHCQLTAKHLCTSSMHRTLPWLQGESNDTNSTTFGSIKNTKSKVLDRTSSWGFGIFRYVSRPPDDTNVCL